MIAVINISVLIISALLCLYFYLKSVRPAALEKKIGAIAYKKCARYRLISSIFMCVSFINYAVYFFYPLSLPIPETFPWSWWISAVIAVFIAVPSGYVFYRGVKDAGSETLSPKKEHTLYSGIYSKIRHPQAVGELPFCWVFSFLLHSPFLVLISFIWIPIFITMCKAEEKDLEIRYGKSYLEYKQRTGAFFPKISPHRVAGP